VGSAHWYGCENIPAVLFFTRQRGRTGFAGEKVIEVNFVQVQTERHQSEQSQSKTLHGAGVNCNMFPTLIYLLIFLLTDRLYTRLSYAITRVRTSASIYNSECSIVDCSIESSTTVRVTILISSRLICIRYP
jgi:hypothetical protein